MNSIFGPDLVSDSAYNLPMPPPSTFACETPSSSILSNHE